MNLIQLGDAYDQLVLAAYNAQKAHHGMIRESHWEADAETMLDHMHEAAEALGYRLVPKDAPDA